MLIEKVEYESGIRTRILGRSPVVCWIIWEYTVVGTYRRILEVFIMFKSNSGKKEWTNLKSSRSHVGCADSATESLWRWCTNHYGYISSLPAGFSSLRRNGPKPPETSEQTKRRKRRTPEPHDARPHIGTKFAPSCPKFIKKKISWKTHNATLS